MESLNTFESEMEADGQGNYSLFPALDSIASLSGTPETLERLFLLKFVFESYQRFYIVRLLTMTLRIVTNPSTPFFLPINNLAKLQRSRTSPGLMLRRYLEIGHLILEFVW